MIGQLACLLGGVDLVDCVDAHGEKQRAKLNCEPKTAAAIFRTVGMIL